MVHEFGFDYVSNGELRTKFIKPVLLKTLLYVRAKVKAAENKGGTTALTLDVWCEDDKGTKFVDGDAKVEIKN
jgi:acyl dehydratase